MATAVRDTQYAPAPTMELVFNPNTGEFEQAPAGSATNGEIVTDMTKDGFAVYIPFVKLDNLSSRSKGILETHILAGKHVVIIGLGSFGSQIAVELAKAGVGCFSLVDFDIVEAHNLARHIAYLNDVGLLKTDVVGDAILGKNPFAKIRKYVVDICEDRLAAEEAMADADLVICATDNNRSRFIVSEIAKKQSKTVILGRAFTRAEGGDVFIYRPGGPCYNCLVGAMGSASEEITNRESALANGTLPAYTSAEDADAMVQVGLSVDIAPICNLMEKLALVELSRGLDSGISSLEDEFVY
ncbi:MAG: ThiF family adenylyltransferase, partial [Bacteroidales bacterium]|nr:ThiF family adenylyltransferase [Bacteroidales bacterium]